MSTNRIRVTSLEYELPTFAYYEFFADPTNLALADVETDADVQAVAFSNQWLHTGLTAGATWYYWVRTVRYNGLALQRSGLLAIGAVTAGYIPTAEIADAAITYAKLQNVSATDKVLGRSSSGAGIVQEIACTAAGRALLAGASAAAQRTTLGAAAASGLATLDGSAYLTAGQFPALTGDVTTAGGGLATTIANNVVTLAKFQQISTARLLGRSTSGSGNVEQLSLGSGLTLSGGVLDVASAVTAVSSVFGRTGAVVAAANDYSFSQLSGSATLAQLPAIADGRILSNVSGGSAVPAANTLTALVDTLGSTQGSVLYRGSSAWAALGPGSSGQVLQSGGPSANPSWATIGGTGTVTSVGLSLPAIFSVSGSPVTGSGTLTGSLANQSANLVFAGPASGSAAAPTFRSLASADLPNLGAAAGTSLALNGATLGSDKLAVTGSARISSGAYFPNGQGIQWASGTTYIIGTDGSFIQFKSTIASQGATLAVFAGLTSPHDFAPLAVYTCDANSTNGNSSAIAVGVNTSTGRSINAGGTINASGADYAEYETKSERCGTVEKGQIIGFDASGQLTDIFSEAVRFGVKSTRPSLVGGDDWASDDVLGASRPIAPAPPEVPSVSSPAAIEKFKADAAAHEKAMAGYLVALSDFEARLARARERVDRVAYSGKVPMNVRGATPGDYICAEPEGKRITGSAIASPTFDQYLRAVGRVNRILPDLRAEVVVIVH